MRLRILLDDSVDREPLHKRLILAACIFFVGTRVPLRALWFAFSHTAQLFACALCVVVARGRWFARERVPPDEASS